MTAKNGLGFRTLGLGEAGRAFVGMTSKTEATNQKQIQMAHLKVAAS
jgi:hypothetical protein